LELLATRTADPPLEIPAQLPTQTEKSSQPRYNESSVYPYLETNVNDLAMSFSQERIQAEVSELSKSLHGPNSPFRHWTVILKYIQSLIERRGYRDLISYNTTVERAEKIGGEWKLTLRKPGEKTDYWWVEWFDALVVASGHYAVPYIPHTPGLEAFAKSRPGSVTHSKNFRGRDDYHGKVSSTKVKYEKIALLTLH
jgi:cation diffusion facilitator CzcD-associated flavoprotein CzcO